MINWKVRLNNPTFWVNTIVSIVIAILGYMGLAVTDLTSWDVVWNAFMKAVQTPYVWIMAGVMVYNALIDPTTKGLSDSKRAMTYNEPNDDTK